MKFRHCRNGSQRDRKINNPKNPETHKTKFSYKLAKKKKA